jgi:hypothetical protein
MRMVSEQMREGRGRRQGTQFLAKEQEALILDVIDRDYLTLNRSLRHSVEASASPFAGAAGCVPLGRLPDKRSNWSQGWREGI